MSAHACKWLRGMQILANTFSQNQQIVYFKSQGQNCTRKSVNEDDGNEGHDMYLYR